MNRLYGALAAGIVRCAIDRWENPQPPRLASPGEAEPVRAPAGAPMHGRSLGNFEQACALLVRLRVADAFDETGARISGGLHPYRHGWSYRLAVDGHQVAAAVAVRAASGDLPPLDEVLAVWLGCAGHFDLIRGTRALYVPQDDARDVIAELVRLGYAKTLGPCILWTDAIATAMRLASAWDTENRSCDDLDETAIDADMRAALKSLPGDVRDAALRNSVLEVQIAISSRWRNGAWTAPQATDTRVVLLGGIARAKRLIELATLRPTARRRYG